MLTPKSAAWGHVCTQHTLARTCLEPADLHWPVQAAFIVLEAVLPCVSGLIVNCDLQRLLAGLAQRM